MAYVFSTPTLGLNPVASTILPGTVSGPQPAGRSTPGRLGTIAKAYDPVYGEGEFIYLKGVATTAIGTLVLYDQYLNTTTIAPVTGGVGPVAVAMSANVANQYGWYQIGGVAAVLAPNAMVPGAGVYMAAAAAGSVDDAVVSGEQIINAAVTTTTGTPAAGLALINIDRPALI